MIKTPDYIANLKPYVPGKPIEELQREFSLPEVFKLASNENPLGPSPKAVEAMKDAFNDIHRYPDPGAYDLRTKIARKFDVDYSNICVGSGSEGIMANLLRSYLCEGDEMITSEATFIGFQVLARGRANKTHFVPMSRDSYKFDTEAIASRINEKTKIIYLCNPNNPTGTIITKDEFENLYSRIPKNVLIIMDEAYFEYAQNKGNYPDSMNYKYDNVITLRTFSKIYGIAGVRIGYGISHKEIAETIMKVKLPFEPNSIAKAGADAALDDTEFVEKSLKLNERGYDYLTEELQKHSDKGKLKIITSYANFIMIDLFNEEKVDYINNSLLKEGVIIRPLKAFGLPECLRITIGVEKENKAFIEAFNKYI